MAYMADVLGNGRDSWATLLWSIHADLKGNPEEGPL